MEVVVTIYCKDKLIEIPINDLLNYHYFKTLLSNFSTKMTKETSNNVDIYTIPHITLECDSHIFMKLLTTTEINYFDTKNILDLLYFNGLFDMNVKIGSGYYRSGDYFYLVTHIKSTIPTVNVYDYLDNGGFRWTEGEMYYSFKLGSKNELPQELCMDLIEKINFAVAMNHSIYWYKDDIVHVVGFIITCYKNGFEEALKNKVDFEPIKMILINYAKNSKYYAQHSWSKEYDDIIPQLYNKMKELCEFIELFDIGVLEDYQFHK
jgi:hypothetical protein